MGIGHICLGNLKADKYLDTINNTFYDWFFYHHTSLKILVIALAMPAFLASFGKKITAVKNEYYLYPGTYDFLLK